jgi:AcrR family transcriptional regulator
LTRLQLARRREAQRYSAAVPHPRSPSQPKRTPRQERSRSTVEFILEAAAQIMARDGTLRLTTNRIAETAGVAVASLYQYFPNKEAIVSALFEQELAEERAEVAKRTGELRGRSIRETIRVGIESVIALHARRPKLVKSILELLPLLGRAEALSGARQQVIELVRDTLRARHAELRAARAADIRAFVIVQAVEGVIHAAAAERPEYLTDPEFGRELVEMIDRFLLD